MTQDNSGESGRTKGAANYSLLRVPAQIAGLDTILHGGFLQGGIYIITGDPGTGKTVLGNQICYNHMAAGGRALYITLLAEEHSRLFAHLASFDFFDPKRIDQDIHYFGAYDVLEREGLKGLLAYLRQVIRENRPTLLVIDGMAAIDTFATSSAEVKHLIQGLQVTMTTMGTTALLLTHLSDSREHPEYAQVDGMIELSYPLVGRQAIRELRIIKFRGSSYVGGQHSFDISTRGLTVYPRSEAILRGVPPQVDGESRSRLALGIPGLNEMLRGGVLAGSSTLLLGVPGGGKTLLGLHFLVSGARKKEVGLSFSFYESPSRLIYKAEEMGLELSAFVQEGKIELMHHRAIEGNIDAMAEELLGTVKERGVQRLFLDGVGGFKQATIYPERLTPFFTALINELQALGVTSIFTAETRRVFGTNLEIPTHGLSDIVDNIIFLRYVELQASLYRLISILKARETEQNMAIREFKISNSGIEVADTFNSAAAILTGIARPLPPTSRSDATQSGEW